MIKLKLYWELAISHANIFISTLVIFVEILSIYHFELIIDMFQVTETTSKYGFLKTIIKIEYHSIPADFTGSFSCGANFDNPSSKIYLSSSSETTVLCKWLR